MVRRHSIRWWAAALLVTCGCLSWDDLTSREFKVASLWTAPPPPMVVIEKSSDGFARAKAFNKLDEPGNPTELDAHINVLQKAAVSDRDPLCRIAALRTLARYKDPRAVKILTEVYLGNPGMSAENNAFIRQQALTSLQVSAPAEARQLFIQAAKQPAGSLTGQAQRDRLEILDERLTAIRALGKYPQQDAVETLVKLLETEKDIAIRKCAQESLVASTKKDFPADGKVWREYLASGKEPARQNGSMLAGLTKSLPTPATDRPHPFETIANWIKPENKPDANPVSTPKDQTTSQTTPRVLPGPATTPAVPGTLPATLPPALPSTPVSPNQVRRDPAPISSPATPVNSSPATITPTGSYRNAQGELVVPATP